MPDEQKKTGGFWQKMFAGEPEPKQRTAAPPPHTESRVAADPLRCVQCGICAYNCPVGIPVRDYARVGKIVSDPRCVQCGQCIEACPRGTLRWSQATLRKESTEATYDDLVGRHFNQPAREREAQK